MTIFSGDEGEGSAKERGFFKSPGGGGGGERGLLSEEGSALFSDEGGVSGRGDGDGGVSGPSAGVHGGGGDGGGGGGSASHGGGGSGSEVGRYKQRLLKSAAAPVFPKFQT